MEPVVLSLETVAHAEWLATTRRQASLARGLQGAHGLRRGPVDHLDFAGALGECAVAEYLGLPLPTSVNTFKREPDVPPYFEVRTGTQPHYRLIVRDDDHDDRMFVLVLLTCTQQPWGVTIAGWMSGADAKNPAWRRAPNGREPAYFVPTRSLAAMSLWVPPI